MPALVSEHHQATGCPNPHLLPHSTSSKLCWSQYPGTKIHTGASGPLPRQLLSSPQRALAIPQTLCLKSQPKLTPVWELLCSSNLILAPHPSTTTTHCHASPW